MAGRIRQGAEKNASTPGTILHHFSDLEVKPLYTLSDIKDNDYFEDIGLPGMYPYTRGVQSTMYRARLWTMRMFAGLGTAEDTNKRFHYLINRW